MAIVFKHKRGTSKPSSSDLAVGEIGIDTALAKLFTENDSGYVWEAGELLGSFSSSTITYTVTVASKTSAHRYNGTGSSSGYKINGVFAPFLSLTPGNTYRFDQSDASNSNHPLKFYLEAAKFNQYTTGVTFNGTAGQSGAYTEITISDTTPLVLHYQCAYHGHMGNSVLTNSKTVNYNDLQNKPSLFSGNYNDLSNQPSLFSGSYNDLSNKPSLFSGSYNDLSNKPTIPTNNNQLTNGAGYITNSDSSITNKLPLAGGTLTGDLVITSTDAGSAAAPEFELYRNSSSPADGDYLGQFKFTGESDDGSKEVYAKVTGKISDASSGTEDGLIEFTLRKAGSNNIGARLTSTALKLINGTALEVAGGADITGDITVSGTVDNRDVAADGTKLDGIEVGAEVNPTNAETKTAYEANSNTNAFTDSEKTKLSGIAASANNYSISADLLDEDNMASNSATKVPSQQSVKAYVDTEVANVVDSAPSALNTLNELAAALGDDANFSTTVTNSIGTKLPLAGGTMTGDIVMAGSQTVDGRDLSVDGTKLDGIESNATADQTASEIRTLVESASDSNVFTDADHTKLNNIEANATADQTAGEILALLLGVDGAGSNLDSDKLDGQQGSYYLDYNNFSNTPSIPTNNNQLTNGAGYITSAALAGASDGGNAALLDGIDSTQFLRSDQSDTVGGQLNFNFSADEKIILQGSNNPYIQIKEGSTNKAYLQWNASGFFVIANEEDGSQLRIKDDITFSLDGSTHHKIWHAGNDGSGSGLDADLLDGQQGSYYLNYNNLNNKPSLFSGSYNDLSNKPTIPTNNNQLTNGAGYVTANTQLSTEQVQDIVGAMVSSNSETNISVTYDDTNGKLNFSSTDTNTTYSVGDGGLTQKNFTTTLKNKLDGIAAGATNTAAPYYTSAISVGDGGLTQKNFTTTLKNKLDGIAAGATNVTNNNQLTNGAGYSTFSGSYNDLSNKPSLFSGSYNDLSNKPTIPTNNNQLTNGAGYSTFSGSYNDLSNKPTIPTNNNQLSNGAGYSTYSSNQATNTNSSVTFASIVSSGNITAYSDLKLKTEIHTIKNPLDMVTKLRGVNYKWLNNGQPDIGVIAQEVEEVIPEIVKETDDGIKTVDYGRMVCVLIESIKELNAKVKILEGKN